MVEDIWNVIYCCTLSANLTAMRPGVCYTVFDPGACYIKIQFVENTGHFEKCFAYRINRTITAINRNRIEDYEAQFLFSDNIYDLVQLLCRTGSPQNLCTYDSFTTARIIVMGKRFPWRL